MTIGAGIEVGILDLNQKVDAVANGINRMIEDFQEQRSEAWMLDLTEQLTVGATGFAYVSFGGPPASYYWVVRFLSISDSGLWTATATGSGQFGKAATQPIQPNTPQPPATVRNPFTTMPFSQTIGTNQFNMKHGDVLYCQVTGATNGQSLQATVSVEQWSVFARAKMPAGPESDK